MKEMTVVKDCHLGRIRTNKSCSRNKKKKKSHKENKKTVK